MKKTLLVAFSAWILVATACGPKPETTTTSIPGGGTVTTTQQQDQTRVTVEGPDGQSTLVTSGQEGQSTVTVRGPEGESTYSASTKVDQSAFSVPFYPGAKVESGSQHEMAGPEGKTSRMVTAELSTTDPVEHVVEFYAGKLPGANKMDSTVEGRRTVIFVPEDPEHGTTVTIDQEGSGLTRLVLVSQGG